MRDHDYREHDRPEDLLQELGYETADIHYKKFANYIGFFFGFFVFCALAGFVVMYFMVPTKLSGARMADYVPKTQAPPSTPWLQSNITARTDIMSLRRQETAILTTSALIDQKQGIYRIPISSAIDILAKRGLPKTAAMQTGGSVTGGQSGEPAGTSSAILPGDQAGGQSLGSSRSAGAPPVNASPSGNTLSDRGESATSQPATGGSSGK